jgi:hypothetical protein
VRYWLPKTKTLTSWISPFKMPYPENWFRRYKSVDTITNQDDVVNYPTEFLNSLEMSGLPPHNLQLKVGSVIIMLRNINQPRLCNGTRLSVKKLMTNVIEVTILKKTCWSQEFQWLPPICRLNSNVYNFPSGWLMLWQSTNLRARHWMYVESTWDCHAFPMASCMLPVQE